MELAGGTLLITGGTGTFGNAVLRRFLGTNIGQIRVFSRDEKKQDDMRREYRDPRLRFYIGDVRESTSVRAAMEGVDFVFHAAALKQVPSCEFFPMEAIRTNCIGAENVLAAAMQESAKKVIVLSTDKAVYPINAMGLSKALMEKLMLAKARSAPNTICCGTRYGNVMASRGSVIPLFVSQIKAGEPLTVTDGNMTRFMMSIEDAVDLVLFAFQQGGAGDLFVQKAPSATIETLARSLLRIFDCSNPITTIGTRHGEKLFETLLTREERARAKESDRYFKVPPDTRDLNYSVFFTEGQAAVSGEEDYTSHNSARLGEEELVALLEAQPYIRQELRGWRQ